MVTDAPAAHARERSRDAAYDRLAGAGAELVTTGWWPLDKLHQLQAPRVQDMLAWSNDVVARKGGAPCPLIFVDPQALHLETPMLAALAWWCWPCG